MTPPLSRRDLLTGAGAMLAAPAARLSSETAARAQTLTGGIKITMPVGQLTEEALAFVAYLGVEYITTGGPASPTYTPEGRVVQARPNDPPPPWKDEDLRRMKDSREGRPEARQRDAPRFPRRSSGVPGADEDIEKVQSRSAQPDESAFRSSNTTGTRRAPWAATTRSPAAAAPRLLAHDYDRSRNLPMLD